MMKKILLTLVCILAMAVSAVAEVKTVYVNPIRNDAGVDAVIAKRLYKKALLGLTKAKTIAVSSGPSVITAGTPDATKYDFIMNLTIKEAPIVEAGTVGNLLGALSSSSQQQPDWEGRLVTEIEVLHGPSALEAFKTTRQPRSTNKDKGMALFNATNNFDYDMTDLTDDAFRVWGTVGEPFEVDKKNIVKSVRVDIGSKNGARRNQMFEIFKVTGDKEEPVGFGKCEQVLNDSESVISINGKKGADKVITELIQNRDGSYNIEVYSRSKNSFLHSNFQGLDKMFTNEGRSHYLDPFGRSAKPTVAFLAVEVNDSKFASQKDNFQNAVVEGMENVPTINLVRTVYPTVEAAGQAGIDGLIEITVDKVFNTTGKTAEGKTKYETEILYTLAGIDVAGNRWIDMKSYHGLGDSDESYAKANADALTLLDGNVQKFSEDVFPVAAKVLYPEEIKNNSAKKVRVNVGTDMGLKKGMNFDIYEQRSDGGADSRILLGEGKVEKDGLTPGEAILKIKGKNKGDEKLATLLQNANDNIEIVAISKAGYDILDKGLNFFNRTK